MVYMNATGQPDGLNGWFKKVSTDKELVFIFTRYLLLEKLTVSKKYMPYRYFIGEIVINRPVGQ